MGGALGAFLPETKGSLVALTSSVHLRVFSTPAENQQASLQLLCLGRVQRSAVDGQNPELHL